jgi:hypothetical protein
MTPKLSHVFLNSDHIQRPETIVCSAERSTEFPFYFCQIVCASLMGRVTQVKYVYGIIKIT